MQKIKNEIIRRIPIIFLVLVVFAGGNAFAQEQPVPSGNRTETAPLDEFGEFEEFAKTNQKPVFDPLSGYNRAMTVFNDKAYFWVLEPTASGYATVIPEGARLCVNRFFRNLGYPVRGVNNLLQLKGRRAAEETFRFVINTTVGVVGLFDPAQKWYGLEPHPEDFGQTLGRYGVGGGFTIVLPFLGVSNLRDTIGLVPDGFLYPLDYLDNTYAAVGITAYERVNFVSLHLGEYEKLTKDALDLYIFLRDAYEQNRRQKIRE